METGGQGRWTATNEVSSSQMAVHKIHDPIAATAVVLQGSASAAGWGILLGDKDGEMVEGLEGNYGRPVLDLEEITILQMEVVTSAGDTMLLALDHSLSRRLLSAHGRQ